MTKKINKKKCEFLICIYLSFVIIGFISFFAGMVNRSAIIATIGMFCGCFVVLLNVDEIVSYVADGMLSALKEAEKDGVVIELDKCKKIASKRRKYRPHFLWVNKCRII